MKPLWITIEPSKPRQIIIQLLILFYSNGAYDFPPTGMIIKASNVPPNYNFIWIYMYVQQQFLYSIPTTDRLIQSKFENIDISYFLKRTLTWFHNLNYLYNKRMSWHELILCFLRLLHHSHNTPHG